MFLRSEIRIPVWLQSWTLIFGVVAAILVAIQIIRINSGTVQPESTRLYTRAGELLTGSIEIAATDFHSVRIDLNRRARLRGSFRTSNLQSTVFVLVLREESFESFRSGAAVAPIVETGFVPGGKIAPVLEPGVYFLIIDNRKNDRPQNIFVDFVIE